MPGDDRVPTDEQPAETIAGGVQVSKTQLGHVYDYAKSTSEGVIRMEGQMSQVLDEIKRGTNSQIRVADIMEERWNLEKEARERTAKADEAEEARRSKRDDARFALLSRAGSWMAEKLQSNWQIIAILLAITVSTGGVTAAADWALSWLGVEIEEAPVEARAAPAPAVEPIPAPAASPED